MVCSHAGIGVRGNWTQILMPKTVGLNITDMNFSEETMHKRTNIGRFLWHKILRLSECGYGGRKKKSGTFGVGMTVRDTK